MKKKVSKPNKLSRKADALSKRMSLRSELQDISEHASTSALDGDLYVSNGVLYVDFRLFLGSTEEAQKCARSLRRAVEGIRKKSVVALKSKFAAFNKKY